MPSSSRGESRAETQARRLELLVEGDPDAALLFARDIVARERAHRVLEPALDLLASKPDPADRTPLRERFDDLTENGMRFDQDCSLRIKIVQVLRAIGSPEDVDLAERGVRLIQLNPPSRIDVAQALRGQCLLLLADLTPDRAKYFAVELLQDPHLSTFSGEPAVTAIQVLAERANILPIWALARRTGSPPDVLAQAFASLRGAPPDLQLDALQLHLKDAAERGENGEGVSLVAAEAIVLNHLAGGYGAVIDLLQVSPNLNLYQYLVLTAARGGDETLHEQLRASGVNEKDPRKIALLSEALGTRRRSR